MSAPTLEQLTAAQAGDRLAQERLVVENERLIWSIVRRFAGRGVEQEDLFQLGCIGFLKAIQGFDPGYGTQFSTYAVPKIAGEMRRFLRDDGPVKVSRTLREQNMRLVQARAELRALHGEDPTLSQLAAYLAVEPEELALAEAAAAPVASLSAETGEGLTLESLLGDEGLEEELVERLDLRTALGKLADKERKVLLLRYYRCFTQEQTAKVVGVSQVQISRIERKGIEHLKAMICL